MGAAAGLLATLLLLIALIISLAIGPGGDPSLPNVNDAQFFPAFLQANLSTIRSASWLRATTPSSGVVS